MRKRSQSERAQQGERRVLSRPVDDRALALPKDDRTSVRAEAPVAVHSQTDNAILNAFWQKTDLTMVIADSASKNGIRYRRIKAEHSCFVKLADLENFAPWNSVSGFHRMINSHHSVRKALIEGEWLRIVWSDRDALKHYVSGLQEKGLQTYEGMVSPVLRHMVDNDMRPAPPRQAWIDIETDSRVPFSRKEDMRVLCWVIEDAHGKVYRGLLDDDTDEDETRLLLEMWNVLEHYDQVMAWNGDRFDFEVIKARSERHKLLFGTDREWRRWLWLDHLDLFRRMNITSSESGDEKQSYSLNAVSTSLLGVGKHPFDASKTWEAWAAGGTSRQALVDYCAQDTALMPRIEQKTGYIRLLQTVADTCGTFPDTRGSNPGVQVEGFLARLAKLRGHKFPTVLKIHAGDQYEGAYVLHPQKEAGIHRDVHVADFAAMYPSIIRTWNQSPETITDDTSLPTAYSPLTRCHFRTDIAGILPEAVKQLMELRAQWNKKKKAAPPGTDAWKDADRRATAYKTVTNSFYGVIGAPTSRFYDRRVAESVTQCGKWLILETIKAAELRGMKVIYGDTDSIFVANATRSEFSQFVQWCNEDLYPRILQAQGCVDNVVELGYEKQFDRLVFTTAKRYLGNFLHYKGTEADATSKPEIKGLEFKRGDSLKVTRDLQQEVVHNLVGFQCQVTDNPVDFEAIVERWMNRVLEERLELADVLTSHRLNKALDDYTANTPMLRVAKELLSRGRDVSEGAKIDYVVIDASQSPQVVVPAEDYDPDASTIDRIALWDKLIWPPTERVLKAAFPGFKWTRFAGLLRVRKTAAKAQAKLASDAAKADAKQLKANAKLAAKSAPKVTWNPEQPPRLRSRRFGKRFVRGGAET